MKSITEDFKNTMNKIMEEMNRALEKLCIPYVQPKLNMKAQILLANQIGYVYKKAWAAQKKMNKTMNLRLKWMIQVTLTCQK